MKKVFRMRFALLTAISAALLAGCASGSVVMTGKSRPAIDPDSVKVYSEPPEQFEVIGLVSAQCSTAWTWQAAKDKAISILCKKAAAVGANGIILTRSTDDPWSGAIVEAKAIFCQNSPVQDKGE